MADSLPILQFSGEYRFLSNFYAAPLKHDGWLWPTAEHAYQASKTLVESEKAAIRDCPTPAAAKRKGRLVTLRADWLDVRVDLMHKIVEAKFLQHPALMHALLATADRALVEGNTWGDRFWGQVHGKGANHLGEILMEIRAEHLAKATSAASDTVSPGVVSKTTAFPGISMRADGTGIVRPKA